PLVVAGPVFGIVIRTGVADALIEGVSFWIVRRRLPDRPAAMTPAILAVFPGFIARLTRARDRVSPPELLPGIEVGPLDEAADAVFAAGGADDRHVAHDQRGERQSFADCRIRDLALPHFLACRLVDCEQPPVERNGDDL